jgi:hypothetical protein
MERDLGREREGVERRGRKGEGKRDGGKGERVREREKRRKEEERKKGERNRGREVSENGGLCLNLIYLLVEHGAPPQKNSQTQIMTRG